jgi:hypothetical protein
MTKQRYLQLSEDLTSKLTTEEMTEGWHFCMSEWDGLLIHPECPEYENCTCDGAVPAAKESKNWDEIFDK